MVQDFAQERIFQTFYPKRDCGAGTKFGISLTSGVIAGVAAAIISHPADTLLSKINKAGEGGEGSMFVRMGRIAKAQGLVNLCLVGLPARCVMIGGITAGQFGIFDTLLPVMGVLEHWHYSLQAGNVETTKIKITFAYSATRKRGNTNAEWEMKVFNIYDIYMAVYRFFL